jgi:hypothetical protein
LKLLKYVAFAGTFSRAAVEWLRKELPACNIELTVEQKPADRSEERLGSLRIAREGKTWTVFQDLSSLGYENNYDVEKAVKAALHRQAPTVLPRLQFDSEAEAFSVTARSLDDIKAVAAAVESLKKEGKRAERV